MTKRERDRERQRRRVQMRIGGATVHVGYAPTPELAQQLRRKIREEAPRGHA